MNSQIKTVIESWKNNPSDRTEFNEAVKQYEEKGDWRSIVKAYGLAALYEVEFDRAEEGRQAVEVLNRMLEQAKDESKNLLLVAIGDFQLNWLKSREAAMGCYQKAFHAFRGNTICLARARKVYSDAEDYRRVVGLLEHEIKMTESDEKRARLILELAQINADELQDYDTALQLLDTLNGLPHDEALASELRSLYEDSTSLKAFVETLVERAEEGQSQDPVASANDFLQAAQLEINRPTGLIDHAISYAARAVNLSPNNEDAKILIRSLHRERENYPWPADETLPMDSELFEEFDASHVTQQTHPVSDDFQNQKTSPGTDYSDEIVASPVGYPEGNATQEIDRNEDVYDDEDDAEDGDEENEEENTGALHAVTEELRFKRDQLLEDNNVDAAVEMYETKLKRLRRKPSEPEVMADLAKLLWKEAEDYERAEYYYKRLKLLDSSNTDVEQFYIDYYQQTKEWRKLLVMLMNSYSEADSMEAKRDYTRRIAALGEGPMDSPKTSIDAWRSFQKDFPTDHEANEELKRLYKADGKWSNYVDIIRGEYDALDDSDVNGKISLLIDIKNVYANELRIEPMLISTLQELLELDPDNGDAFSQLREHLESGRRYTDLADLLEGKAKRAEADGDLATASEYYLEVADLWQNTLRNVSAAIPHLERVLELDPKNIAVIDRAIAVYDGRRDYVSVVRLERQKAHLVSKEEAIELLNDASSIAQERLRDPQIIAEVLEEQLLINPEDYDSMKVLLQIYERTNNYEMQVSIRRRMLEQGFGNDEQLLREIATISTEKLDDADVAIDAWNAVLQLSPGNDEATQALTFIYAQHDRFQDLEKLYLDQDKPSELYDILEAAADSSEDKDVKATVYAQMADIAESRLNDPNRTISSLESLKAVSDKPLGPTKRLLALYGSTKNKLAQIQQLQFLIENDNETARPIYLRELRDLYAEVDDSENALKTAARLLLLDPHDSDAYDQAVAIAVTPSTKSKLVKFIDRISDSENDEALTLLNNRRVSRLLVDLEEWSEAVERLEKLEERFPQDIDIKNLLEVAYGGAGQPSKQVELLEAIISQKKKSGAAPEELVNDLSRIADIERNALNEPDHALQSYLDILKLVPDHLESLRGLEEIYRSREQWEDVLNVLEKKRDALPYDEQDKRLEVLYEMSEINVLHLHNPSAAIDLAREVLAIDPKHEKTIRLVEALYDDETVGYDATILLEPYIVEEDDPERLRHNLEVRAQRSNDTFEKVDIFDRLVQLCLEPPKPMHLDGEVMEGGEEGEEKSEEGEEQEVEVIESFDDKVRRYQTAFYYARCQLELDPSREATWKRLDTLASDADEFQLPYDESSTFHDALEQTYASVLNSELDPQTRIALTRKLAYLREDSENIEGAIESYRALYDLDNYDLEAVEGLIRNYEKLSDTDHLVSMLAVKALLVSDPEEQTKWYLTATDLADEVLEDPVRTEQYLKEVIQLQPERYDIQRRLISFYEREEKWEKLGEQLRNYSEVEPDQERKEKTLTSLAQLQWNQLNDDDHAVETYRELLVLTGPKPSTIEEIFAFDDHLAESSLENPVRHEIVELLEPPLREINDKNSLARILRTKLLFVEEPFERAALLDEYSHLCEVLEQPEGALQALREAILVVPDDAQRRDRFQELCSTQEVPEFFVSTYSEAIENLEDPVLAAQMLVQKATWETERLNNVDEAINSLERARTYDENNLTAVSMLDELFTSTQDFENLAKTLRAKALLESEPKDRILSYRRLAALQEEVLDRKEEAIGSWIEVLNILPDDIEAIEALERLFEQESRWNDLTEILNRKIDSSQNEDVRFAAMSKLAVVYEENLNDYPAAVNELQRAHNLRPENTDVLFELRRILSEQGEWAELDEVLKKLLATDSLQRSPELKAELLLQQGDIRSIEMFEVERAIPTYLRVLRFDYPEYRQKAVEALERISNDAAFLDTVAEPLSSYNIANQRWESEVALTHKLAEHASESDRRSLLYQRLADLYDTHLENSRGAFDALIAAWRQTPLNFTLYSRAKEKVEELGAQAEMAETIATQLMAITDPHKNVELRIDLADLYENSLDNRQEAETQYREILLLDPVNDVAQKNLEALLITDERWQDVLELYEQRFQNASARHDEDAAVENLLHMASIHENMLGDPVATVDAYQRVLDASPSNDTALHAILNLLPGQERWSELADFINEKFGFFELEEQRELKLELARIQGEQLANPMLSIEHYVDLLEPDSRLSLDRDSEAFAQAVSSVEGYLHDEQYASDILLRNKAATLLLHVYQDREDWPAIANTHEIISRTTDNPNTKLENLLASADAYEIHLQDYDNARRLRYEIFADHPEQLQFSQAVMNLCFSKDDWVAFAKFLERILADRPTMDPDIRKVYEMTLIEVQEIRLEDVGVAIEITVHCLANDPNNTKLQETLERLHTRKQNWTALAQLYQHRADYAESQDVRIDMMCKLAFLNENFLNDINAAVDIYFDILNNNLDNMRITNAAAKDLNRLLRRQERWFDLVDLLQQMRDTTNDASYSFQLAEIYADRLEQFEDAVDILEPMLINNPSDHDVRRQLRSIQRRLAPLETETLPTQLRVVNLLLNHKPSVEDQKRTLELLKIRVGLLDDEEDRAETYIQIANLSEQRSSISERLSAVVALANAFQLRPYDSELFKRIGELAERDECWDRVPGLLLGGLRNLRETEPQVQLLTAVAWVYREKLIDLTSTIVVLQAVIDLDPSSQEALDALEDSYRSNRQWKELSRILEIRIQEELDPDRRQRSLESLARLNHMVTQRYDRAIENYEELRELEPTKLEYYHSLEDLYNITERWQNLEDLLQENANLVTQIDQQIAVLSRLAEVQKTHTENYEGAIITNIRILDIDSDNDAASLALLDLYEHTERWHELLEALQARLERTDDPARRLELRIKRCRVMAFKTGQEIDALEDLAAILTTDPFCEPAQGLLRELCAKKQTHHEALRILVETYQDSEQWSQLEALYELLLQTLDKEEFREERHDIFLTLIIFYGERDNINEAERVAATACVEFPTNEEILVAFEQVTLSEDAQRHRLEVLEEILHHDNLDPFDYRPTKQLLASTYESFGERRIAIVKWQELLELDAFDVNALQALDRLYLAEENYPELANIIEQEIGVSDSEHLPELRCRLAYLNEMHFDNKSNALDIYADVLTNQPENKEALEGLRRLYNNQSFTGRAAIPLAEHFRAAEDWTSLADVIEGALGHLDERDEVDLRRELISLYLDRLNDPERGFAHLCEAITAQPNDYQLQTHAEELATSSEQKETLGQVYAHVEKDIDDPMRRIDVLSFAGAVCMNQTHDYEKAENLFETVLTIEPENRTALDGLENVARAQNDSDKLITVLNRKAETVFDADVQISAYSEVARLYAADEKYDQAIENFRKALSLDPSNVAIMEELASWLEKEDKNEDLLELLEQESRFVDDPQKRFAVLVRAGNVAQHELEDNEKAIRFYEEAHTILPEHFETMVELEKLYEVTGQIDQRRQILEQIVAHSPDNATSVHYMTLLGAILDESYSDFDGAINYFQRAFDLSKTLKAEESDESDEPFYRLQELYAKNQRWEDLNQLFERRLAELGDDQLEEQIEIRARRADIVAKHLGDTNGAIKALNELLELSPKHFGTLSVLAQLYEKVDNPEAQLDTLNRLVIAAQTQKQGVEAFTRRAQLLEKYNKHAEAVADYVKVIEIDPSNKQAITTLKDIYLKFEAYGEYIKMLDFETSVTPSDKAKIKLLNEAYGIAKDKLQNPDLMILLLERMQDIEATTATSEKLIDAYIVAGETEKASKLIGEAIQTLVSQRKMKDAVRYYHLQGKLLEQKGDEEGALQAYREAHSIDASYLPNLISLGQLLIKHEEWDEALKIFQTLLLHQMNVKDKADKVSIYYNLGLIRIQQGDNRRAKDMFKRVLSIDRDHQPSREQLEKL